MRCGVRLSCGRVQVGVCRQELSDLIASREEFEDQIWQLNTAIVDSRKTLLKPFLPYYEYAGTMQAWHMFSAPHRYPNRLHIDIQQEGQWETVFITGSTEKTWRQSQFHDSRMGSAIFRYGWTGYRSGYRYLCSWVAKQATQDFPNATAIRIRMFKYRTQSPKEIQSNEPEKGRFHMKKQYTLPFMKER